MSLCPGEGFDSHGCYIQKDGSSWGCAEGQFCHYVGNPDDYHQYQCAWKLNNTESCMQNSECKSGMCSTYFNKDNFCYGCVAYNKDDGDHKKG